MGITDRELAWDERGLLPAIVQDARTGAVLMVAWMNAESLEATRTTGLCTFYSRSRQKLWQKGETSGHTLHVREIRVDCDMDTILVAVEPAGPACHTDRTSCFFRVMENESGRLGPADDGPPGFVRAADADADAGGVLARLERVLVARRDGSSSDKSYTRSLLDKGFPEILAKIAEEHGELADELPAGPESAVVHETADLLFHVLVGLVARDIPLARVWRELERRFGVSGHREKASRGAPTKSS